MANLDEPQEPQVASISSLRLGLPGQTGRLMFVAIDASGRELRTPGGQLGSYSVTITLKRPGHALTEPGNISLAEELEGDSPLQVGLPRVSGAPVARLTFVADAGQNIPLEVYANSKGMLAKYIAKGVPASAHLEAEQRVYSVVAPFLSQLAVQFEIPFEIAQVDVLEVATGMRTLTYTNAFPTSELHDSIAARVEPEPRGYASIYREAIVSNSPFYQFLCFFKIIEQLQTRRRRLGPDVAAARIAPFPKLRVPGKDADVILWLRDLYPPLARASDADILDIIVPEVRGKNIAWILETRARPIRDRIAHALFDFASPSAEPMQSFDNGTDLDSVRYWLATMRTLARWHMKVDLGLPR